MHRLGYRHGLLRAIGVPIDGPLLGLCASDNIFRAVMPTLSTLPSNAHVNINSPAGGLQASVKALTEALRHDARNPSQRPEEHDEENDGNDALALHALTLAASSLQQVPEGVSELVEQV
jgi:hypothetical protein